jgi:hypothetical protein
MVNWMHNSGGSHFDRGGGEYGAGNGSESDSPLGRSLRKPKPIVSTNEFRLLAGMRLRTTRHTGIFP